MLSMGSLNDGNKGRERVMLTIVREARRIKYTHKRPAPVNSLLLTQARLCGADPLKKIDINGWAPIHPLKWHLRVQSLRP